MSPRLLLVALQLLTRMPVGDPVEHEGDVAASVSWFPVVGALIGGLGAFVYWATSLPLPQVAAATLATAVMTIATGGLHEDGLADTFDGLYGGRTPEDRIRIMKDSALGSYGAGALLLTVLFKVSLIAGLPAVDGAAAIIVSAAIGRGAAVVALLGAVPARQGGAGARLMDHLTVPAVVASGLIATIATVLLAGLVTPFVVLAVGSVVFALRQTSVRRIGGLTGDVIGAMIMLGEVASLAILVAFRVTVPDF